MFKKVILISFLFFIFSIGHGLALDLESLGKKGIEYKITPQYIEPKQEVTVGVVSYSYDLNRSEVSYYLDGQLISAGFGLREVSFVSPEAGSESTLFIKAVTLDGVEITKTIDINPLQVDLIYESMDAHKPTFYKGKAYELSGSDLRFVAFPTFYKQGVKLDPNKLIYNWYINNKFQNNSSGYAKSTFEMTTPAYPNVTRVSVEVESLDGSLKFKRSIDLQPRPSDIVFYKEDPIFGFEFKNPSKKDLVSKSYETSIVAVPYFMTNLGDPEITEYRWRIAKRLINVSGTNRNKLNFSNNPEDPVERLDLQLEIENMKKVLQSVSKSFNLIYDFSSQKEDNAKRFFDNSETKEEDDGPNFFGL